MATFSASAFQPGGIAYVMREARGLPPLETEGIHSFHSKYPGAKLEPVMWRDVIVRRKRDQALRLDRIRQPSRPVFRPAQVLVFDCPGLFGFAYKGWWCYIRDARDHYIHDGSGVKCDIRHKGSLAKRLMTLIPMGIFPMDDWKSFEAWMEAFAEEFPIKSDRWKRAGYLNGWTDGRDFWLTKPEMKEEADA